MGTATGTGTKTSPLNSIAAAIALAEPEGGATPKRVYVCAGTYDETVTIDSSHDKVKVYGGFTCANGVWTYTGDLPKLAPSTTGVVVTMTNLTSALFADMEIDAQSAPSTPPSTGSAPGASSIAVTVSNSSGVEFRRSKIVAGNGQPGADGVLVPYTFPSAMDLHGNAGSGGTGGAAKVFTCPGGTTTTGGKGGDSPAGDGSPGLPDLGLGLSGSGTTCAAGSAWGAPMVDPGKNATAAGNAAGAQTPGAFMKRPGNPPEGRPGRPVVPAKAVEVAAQGIMRCLGVEVEVEPVAAEVLAEAVGAEAAPARRSSWSNASDPALTLELHDLVVSATGGQRRHAELLGQVRQSLTVFGNGRRRRR